jgi:hypothetical protein
MNSIGRGPWILRSVISWYILPVATSTGLPTVLLLQSPGPVHALYGSCHTWMVFEKVALPGVMHRGGTNGAGSSASWIVFRQEANAFPSRVMVFVTLLQLSVVPSQPHPAPPHRTATPFTYGTIEKLLRKPVQVFPVTWYVTSTKSGGPPVGFVNAWSKGLVIEIVAACAEVADIRKAITGSMRRWGYLMGCPPRAHRT